MKLPRPLIHDPGLTSLKSAARAAIVMPAVFAIADQLIAEPQAALFAAFGSFAMLVLASFTGPTRDRFIAYLSLGVAGAVLVPLGTAFSGNAWLAAGAMAVVGFAILFSGVINGYFSAGGTAAVLVFVLSVSVPAPAAAIPWRLAGWGLAATAGILAVMFLWPPRERATLRADTARVCVILADLADSMCGNRPAEPARLKAAQQAVDELRGRLTTTPHRPTGPTRPMAALAGLIDELGWLAQSLTMLAGARPGELCADENSAALRAAASVLRACAGELQGRPELSAGGPAGKPPVVQLDAARETASQVLARRISALPRIPDEESLQGLVDRGFRVHAISFTTRQIAAYAWAASPLSGPRPDGVPSPSEMAAAPGPVAGSATALAQTAPPGEDPLSGQPRRRYWPRWLPGWLGPAEDFTVTHADYRSVWFRNSVRGAAGLAIAVFIAQKTGLQHSFWVVLGTLSVLRSNALGTGRSVLSALAGTAVGILVGAAILIPVSGHDAVLWFVLPVAVLLGAYAPRVISFAAGQAAFTIVVLVLFNIIQPAGWKVGIIRIEDVAVGFAISLGVGLVFWPSGAATLLRQNLAAAYSRTADYVAAMIEQLSGLDGGADPGRAELAALVSVHRLDDSFSQFLSERSAQRLDPERVSRVVGGVAKVLRAGQSLAALNALAAGRGRGGLPGLPGAQPPAIPPGGPVPLTLARPGAAPGGGQPGTAAGDGRPGAASRGGQPGTAASDGRPGAAAGGGQPGTATSGGQPGYPADQRPPCADGLDQEVLKLRAWYVTLGDSVVNGTALPPPEHRDRVARQHLLECARQAISSGQPTAARGALMVLWASEHLDALWRLEEHLGRPLDTGPAAAAGPVTPAGLSAAGS
jgi:uncharacterized membrane protein YccC